MIWFDHPLVVPYLMNLFRLDVLVVGGIALKEALVGFRRAVSSSTAPELLDPCECSFEFTSSASEIGRNPHPAQGIVGNRRHHFACAIDRTIFWSGDIGDLTKRRKKVNTANWLIAPRGAPKVAMRIGDWKVLATLTGPAIKPYGDIRPGDQQQHKIAERDNKIAKLEDENRGLKEALESKKLSEIIE